MAFTAGLSTHTTLSNGATIHFDVIVTNKGNGYNPNTGVFTAPKAGTYFFAVVGLCNNAGSLDLRLVIKFNLLYI